MNMYSQLQKYNRVPCMFRDFPSGQCSLTSTYRCALLAAKSERFHLVKKGTGGGGGEGREREGEREREREREREKERKKERKRERD